MQISSKVLSGLMIVALATPATLAQAADSETRAAGAPGIQASAHRAAQAIVLQSTQTAAPVQTAVPRTMPRTGKTSKQMSGGGGSMMMVMGIVGTVAGLAGTYYVVKAMRDQTKDVSTAAGLR